MRWASLFSVRFCGGLIDTPALLQRFAWLTGAVTVWTVFVFTFLIASITTNLVSILIYLFVDLGFLFIAASYFAKADGHASAANGLQIAGGASCFVAGLLGWYVFFFFFFRNLITATRFLADSLLLGTSPFTCF